MVKFRAVTLRVYIYATWTVFRGTVIFAEYLCMCLIPTPLLVPLWFHL